MSVPTLDPPETPGTGLLGPVNTVMGAIFDSVEDKEAEESPEPGDEAPPAVGAEPEPTGDDGEPPAAGEAEADPAGGTEEEPPPAATEVRSAPPVVTVDDKAIAEKIGSLSEALDTRFTESFQKQALEEAQEEYPHYLDMLKLHPLELVGKELPSIDGSDDDVVFRTADEVKDYQEAVKTILQRELEASVAQKQEESAEVLDVIHASIDLFRDNPDLFPGSKNYNKKLASEFVKLAEPYALKMNGKLTGYSIPVQGLVNQVRARVTAEAKAATTTPPAKKAAAPGRKPQAGIPSQAGASGDSDEDFTPMWKALGIDSVPI